MHLTIKNNDMEKQELLEKIEKFDLTDEQLVAIDNIIAGEMEIEDYTEILHKVSKQIANVDNMVVDIGDVGNEIGIAIGKFIKNEEDKKDFVDGIYHGISLIDGTHDLGKVFHITKLTKKKKKKKKNHKKKIKRLAALSCSLLCVFFGTKF